MTDYTDDDRRGGGDHPGDIDEDPPIYRSGRVRIIGAEPAGDAIREVTGPVVEENPDMPHWNDAPTGQVPAILDRANGEEPSLAPPSWREDDSDWAAHEEAFEPSMLSDDQPAVGSMVNDNNEQVDVERQPWHFEPVDLGSDEETLIIASPLSETPADDVYEPDADRWAAEAAATQAVPVSSSPVRPEATAAAASRLSPPEPPEPKVRSPRSSRIRPGSRNSGNGNGSRSGAGSRTATRSRTSTNGHDPGTSGRDMRVAVGSGVLLGVVALACFKGGNLPAVMISTLVVLLASAEAFAAFRRAQYHPATLLGLVAVASLMIETYNKGVAALPLVMVMLVAASFVWYLARVEPDADPVSGVASTVLVFVWVGGLGSFSALLLSPSMFPNRHGVAFMLAAVLTTVAADVAALLVGSAMGKHPMAPSISPNKTWEGFVGGAVASILMAVVVVHFIHPWTIGKALVLGVVVAIVAPLGDLSQSMIKRHLGVKDMSRLMPGHGGILDRVDGLLFVLPATYFVVKALHLG
jgi:CDP-diglyceride synthetase